MDASPNTCKDLDNKERKKSYTISVFSSGDLILMMLVEVLIVFGLKAGRDFF